MRRFILAAAIIALPGVAWAQQYKPDFNCSADHSNDSIATMLCQNSEAAMHELIFDQTYYALRQIVGKNGWKSLKVEAIADDDALKECVAPPTPEGSLPAADPSCYISKMDAITAKYKQRLSGSSLEEANRSIDQHIALQQKLIDIGYLPSGSKADGVYGEATRQAIQTWQRVNRMPSSDGILSDKDANVLLSSGLQPRASNADYSAVNPVGEQDEAPTSPHYRNINTSTEDRLIAIVDEGRTEYENGANDFLKGASRPRRAQKICALMPTPEAQSWVGTIEELSSNSSGYGVLKIRISPNITVGTTNNSFSDALSQQKTLISPNDPVFSQVANLQVGQSVRFSGVFNTSTDDCLSEESITQSGSMRSPEFEIHFTDVQPSN